MDRDIALPEVDTARGASGTETRETERLRLRALEMGDAEPLSRLQADPLMMRYFDDGHAYSPQESRTWLEWHVAMWPLEGYSFWAAELKETGTFLGWLGVSKVWDPPELASTSELGWFVDRRFWGQGLATEGAQAAVDFAFGPVGLDRVIARYNRENVASGRVMQKIGMRFWQDVPHRRDSGMTVRMYEMTREDRASS